MPYYGGSPSVGTGYCSDHVMLSRCDGEFTRIAHPSIAVLIKAMHNISRHHEPSDATMSQLVARSYPSRTPTERPKSRAQMAHRLGLSDAVQRKHFHQSKMRNHDPGATPHGAQALSRFLAILIHR
ncbi:uncharacterized protein BDR25DRAFT_1447 [Lindgomyces ingoldianus]|uniref:Uncharacterized protein n=1 Tax=Lindgomyces ingoldianus TaxID=673940 RepID=A0ACB6RDZ8_9PLEO|nr:uncharacterized protein BDR25DRAFT_1447 [Lindgomyces ingoldianus]KAF2477489.1 hypothetical protein BDR25DRAFT_1447 [Lindgomyces ingoldianus]